MGQLMLPSERMCAQGYNVDDLIIVPRGIMSTRAAMAILIRITSSAASAARGWWVPEIRREYPLQYINYYDILLGSRY